MESLSLIDAVMPDIVATRQQALQQQTQQSGTVTKGPAGLIKQEQESNGDESNAFFTFINAQGLIFRCDLLQIQLRLVLPCPPVTTTHQIYLAVCPPSPWMLTAVLRFPLVKPPFCEGMSLKFLFVRGIPLKTSLPPGKTR